MTTLQMTSCNEPRSAAELIDRYRQVKRRLNPPRTSVRILAALPPIKIPIAVDCKTRSPIAAFIRDPAGTVADVVPNSKEIEPKKLEPVDRESMIACFEVEIRTLSARGPRKRRAKAKAALELVARRTGFSVEEMMCRCRLASRVKARQEAMWAVKIATNWALTSIGRFFNGRDHTTVLHAIRQLQKRAERNVELRAFMTEIEWICAADTDCDNRDPNLGDLT